MTSLDHKMPYGIADELGKVVFAPFDQIDQIVKTAPNSVNLQKSRYIGEKGLVSPLQLSDIEITGDTEEKGHSDPRDHVTEFSACDVIDILKRMNMDRHHH